MENVRFDHEAPDGRPCNIAAGEDDGQSILSQASLSANDMQDNPSYGAETSDDALALYLRDIGDIPRLSASEELALAADIEAGRLEIAKAPGFRKHDVLEAAIRAEERLIAANLRLAVAAANRYPVGRQARLDLIQAGNQGIMHAAQKFDRRRGVPFTVYANYWVFQTVQREYHRSRLIQLPEYMARRVGQVRQLQKQLEETTGEVVTALDVMGHLGLGVHDAEEALALAFGPAGMDPLSLDEPLNPAISAAPLGDTLEDRETPPPDEVALDLATHNEILAGLQVLSERQRQVIMLRYGFDEEGYPRSLAEVARIVGLSAQGVLNLENAALDKLRAKRSGPFRRG